MIAAGRQRTGIIGGSGLYDIDHCTVLDQFEIETPFGRPSAPLTLVEINGHEALFLPRHGLKHHTPPHRINYRANIYAMKLAGVQQIISISAVGSLREGIAPGEFVVVDQFVDRTRGRDSTFFDGPVVTHVSMADPCCHSLRARLIRSCGAVGVTTHPEGSYLVMEGPQFSTRAESNLYRQWGMDVIGMTNMPEAKLAREAEICYATIAMSTDYDCWHEDEEAVSVSAIVAVMQRNVEHAKQLLGAFFAEGDGELLSACGSGCRRALDSGLFADLSAMDDDALRQVHAIIARKLAAGER
ncbi:MAG: S-methyl-5'-thioadenosine phosphorylase [Mariprofundales bacterium]|nr:S-methyl-5'-thioadenosine phosphorylase [Mariprofundales bacterium]